MITEKEFYYVRHGQTDWNLDHRAQGQTDVTLNAFGRRQANEIALVAASLKLGTICSSPLKRAIETANAIANATGSNVTVVDSLMECSWGDREGERKGAWFERWKRGIETPEGAEPYDEFLERAKSAINEVLEYPGPVLIVAHGGLYWAIQLHALRNMDQDLPNAKIVKHTPPAKGFPWWKTSVLGS